MTLHWTDALAQHWGIQATLTQLAGEYDLNFLAETSAGEGYILKAMRPGCDRALIEMQVNSRVPSLSCDRLDLGFGFGLTLIRSSF